VASSSLYDTPTKPLPYAITNWKYSEAHTELVNVTCFERE
jgi:hypothetical protein